MFDEKLMTVAQTLVAYCQKGDSARVLDELFHENAVSVEAADLSGAGVETAGLGAIRGKHEWWDNAFDLHSANAEGPFLHGANAFGVIFEMDATNKETGERNAMRELAIYTVNDGKIVREEFYYQG